MTAWGVQCSRPMPWTTQQCSEWYWPVQNRSLPFCLGRPRAANISRLLPHSQGEWTRCHGCPISDEPHTACTWWWRWSSRSAWTVSATLHVLLSDPFTNEFDDISPGRRLRQVAQLYAGSLALPAFSLSVGPRCRPVLGRHCSEYCMCYQELMAKQGAPLDSCNHSRTVHPCFVAITRTFEAGQFFRG